MSKVLVTGGAGYLGSHMCVQLLDQSIDVVVVDNLSNSSVKSLETVKQLCQKDLKFYDADLRDRAAIQSVFAENDISAVIHFAGLKAVGESVEHPHRYYDNNVNGTLQLIECMDQAQVKTLIFSSSATVYGPTETMPITEEHPLNPISPYGRTKLMIEDMLRDIHAADPNWRISLLRYFNPVGAHPSGQLGEDPNGIPNNLVPNISQVAIGKRPELKVFGDDYPTPDGTCIRDYIHVTDLVDGHLCALRFLEDHGGCVTHNLGTGNGYSVYEVIEAFEAAAKRPIPHILAGRRVGDAAECYADPSKAQTDLGWRATKGLQRMCEDVWRWQTAHPDGFGV